MPEKYRIETDDEEVAMLHMHAKDMRRLIEDWEYILRQAVKEDCGALYGVDIDTIRNEWYELKCDLGLGDL